MINTKITVKWRVLFKSEVKGALCLNVSILEMKWRDEFNKQNVSFNLSTFISVMGEIYIFFKTDSYEWSLIHSFHGTIQLIIDINLILNGTSFIRILFAIYKIISNISNNTQYAGIQSQNNCVQLLTECIRYPNCDLKRKVFVCLFVCILPLEGTEGKKNPEVDIPALSACHKCWKSIVATWFCLSLSFTSCIPFWQALKKTLCTSY